VKTGPKVGPEKSKGLGNPQETLVPDPRALGLKVGDCSDEEFPQRLHVGNLAKDKDLTLLLAINPGTAGPGGTPDPEPAWGVAQLARPHTGRGDSPGNPPRP
jgi:hypothetical protein